MTDLQAAQEKAIAEAKRADKAEFLAAQLYAALKNDSTLQGHEAVRAMEMYEEWEREE